ncbi:MAG: sigma-70 family RNA polymerase sigma factor [Bacteroidota bacterium]
MDLTTEALWRVHGTSLYFFILKRVKDATIAEDVLQNTFLKVHRHLDKLQDSSRAKAWVFQIARNELANYHKGNTVTVPINESAELESLSFTDDLCCFERFLEELPDNYQKVIELVYLEGKTNAQASEELNLSLANIKARIRRAKKILKQRFQECCHFTLNESGKLVGSSHCTTCNVI